MSDIFDSRLVKSFSIRTISIGLSGLALVLSIFFQWVHFYKNGELMEMDGTDVFRSSAAFFEPLVIPLLGIMLIILSLAIAKVPDLAVRSMIPIYLAIALPGISLILLVECGARLHGFIMDIAGTGFFYNAGLGWYLGLVGSVAGLFAAVIPVVEPSLSDREPHL